MLPGLDALPLKRDFLKLMRRAVPSFLSQFLGAATAAASRTALGAGAMGDSLFQAATAAAARVLLGLPTQVASMVRLNTVNGYGSTNTAIRRFTNVVTNQGSDISYGDSATLGGIFTIITAGVYAISYVDNFNAVSVLGISLNSTQLTTAVGIITVGDRLATATTVSASSEACAAWTGYLAAGSVIRAHASATPTGTADRAMFTITRVG